MAGLKIRATRWDHPWRGHVAQGSSNNRRVLKVSPKAPSSQMGHRPCKRLGWATQRSRGLTRGTKAFDPRRGSYLMAIGLLVAS